MKLYQSWFGLAALLLMVLSPCPVSSAYTEGTDTTDINGFSQDSAFRVQGTVVGMVSGIKMMDYYQKYFSNIFEDINKAPDTFKVMANGCPMTNCFIIQRSKDSTYSKYSVLKMLSDGRYLYRFGSNTIPNDLFLINSNYNRTVKYKPNNLYRVYSYYKLIDSLYWEPPIPNNNHLIGYILYVEKRGVTIDTSAPINMAQWDSVAFTNSTGANSGFNGFGYINIVAVYTEGRSEFLLGWTIYDIALGVTPFGKPQNIRRFSHCVTISKSCKSVLFDFKSQNPLSATVFDPSGRQVANFVNIQSGTLLWTTAGGNVMPGYYVLRAVLPDKSTISQSFLVR